MVAALLCIERQRQRGLEFWSIENVFEHDSTPDH